MEKTEVILCSDNHGLRKPLEYLKQTYSSHDYFVHCGDACLPEIYVKGFAIVKGNNDWMADWPSQKILHIASHTILLVHGHRDQVSKGLEYLSDKAKSLDCDMVFFGHTHRYYDGTVIGIRMLNPGSLWHNRDGSEPSYMVIEFEGNQTDVRRMTVPSGYRDE